MARGEEAMIERIRRSYSAGGAAGENLPAGARLITGIGDDAAVLRPAAGRELVLTCDQFLEGAHFLGNVHPPDAVGYKALARAASDLAAMGARPQVFLLSLALPREKTGRWLDSMARGMARAARELGIALAGGDTSECRRVSMSLTLLGDVRRGTGVLRSGARPGELIFVSGTLGAAQLGLEILRRGLARERRWRPLLRAHLYPRVRLDLGEWLAASRLASAMMDISDGLSTDLARLCAASGVGARIYAAKLPAARVPAELARRGLDPLELALDGGEDYELLFTVPRRLAQRLLAPRVRHALRRVGRVPLTCIGDVTRQRRMVLVDARGRSRALLPRGWDPFRIGHPRI
jgi:thiamine-monophosphate kinase